MELMFFAYRNLGEFLGFLYSRHYHMHEQQRLYCCEYSSDEVKYDDDNWHNLPNDVLWRIVKRLTITDYIRMGYTCTSWRTSILLCPEPTPQPAPQLPWLLLPSSSSNNNNNIHLAVLDLLDGMTRKLKLPNQVCGGWCIGSSKGWLVMANGPNRLEPSLFLVNPFSQVTIPLPSLCEIPGYSYFKQETRNDDPYGVSWFINKFELSSSCYSSLSTGLIVACLLFGKTAIFLHKVGSQDIGWVGLGEPLDYDVHDYLPRYEDILFSSDGTTLYALIEFLDVPDAYIETSDLHHPEANLNLVFKLLHYPKEQLVVHGHIPYNPNVQVVVSHKDNTNNNNNNMGDFEVVQNNQVVPYLIEPPSIDDNIERQYLVLVLKIMDLMLNNEDIGDDDSKSIPSFRYSKTRDFRVFVLDVDTGGVSVSNEYDHIIDDLILFVGKRGSLSVSSKEFGGDVRGNCIYFIDDNDYECLTTVDPIASREYGVFDVATGKIKRFIPSVPLSILYEIAWFTPVLN